MQLRLSNLLNCSKPSCLAIMLYCRSGVSKAVKLHRSGLKWLMDRVKQGAALSAFLFPLCVQWMALMSVLSWTLPCCTAHTSSQSYTDLIEIRNCFRLKYFSMLYKVCLMYWNLWNTFKYLDFWSSWLAQLHQAPSTEMYLNPKQLLYAFDQGQNRIMSVSCITDAYITLHYITLHYITCNLADTFIQIDLQFIRLSRRHTPWSNMRLRAQQLCRSYLGHTGDWTTDLAGPSPLA